MEIVKAEKAQHQPYYEGEYFLLIIGDMENVRTFATSLIKVCYNLLQIRHHPNDVFSFFLNHTTEGRTLNLPESFSQVANNLINEKENELCGDSGYYQDSLPDTCQGQSIHTFPLWQERERPFTLSFVLGYNR